MAKVYKLSKEKFEDLKKELAYLKGEREREISQQIKEARSFGDLSENSEYDEAKNEQGKLYSRIGEIETILSSYRIISESDMRDDEVGIGNTVVLDYGDGDTEEIQIVGSQEADPMNMRISDESPLGQAIMEKKCGDLVSYDAPQGQITFRILSIK